jgi:Zn-dependent protease with chaperone function
MRYDGRAPIGQPVTLAIEGDDVAVIARDAIARFPRDALDVDAPIPGVARRLRTPDGAVIEVEPTAPLDAAWPVTDPLARVGSWLEAHWSTTLLAACIGAFVVWLVVAHALPLAADPVARSLSPEIEHAIGKHALATIDRVYARGSRLSDAERRRIAGRLQAFLDDEPSLRDYQLEFRRMGGPNAFALPGRIIVVTDELVQFVHGRDDELLAVIAHELGHLQAHHAVRLVLQQSGVAVLATVLAGDAVGMTFLAAAVPAMLLDSRYSRAFEQEADDYAFALLARHEISPQVFADVMRRFARDQRTAAPGDPVLRYLSSHPPTGERIDRAEQAARAYVNRP